jgi:hypothetical protein
MRWRKVDWLFVALALAVVVGVSLLPAPKDRNPKIPANPDHQPVTVEKNCVVCHVSGGAKPVPERHPTRQDCFRCHARELG